MTNGLVASLSDHPGGMTALSALKLCKQSMERQI